MRISARDAFDRGESYDVYLDNVLVKNCVEADDDEGYVEVIMRNDISLDGFVTGKKHGQVRIEKR